MSETGRIEENALMIGLNYTFGIHSVLYSIFHIPSLKVNSRQGNRAHRLKLIHKMKLYAIQSTERRYLNRDKKS